MHFFQLFAGLMVDFVPSTNVLQPIRKVGEIFLAILALVGSGATAIYNIETLEWEQKQKILLISPLVRLTCGCWNVASASNCSKMFYCNGCKRAAVGQNELTNGLWGLSRICTVCCMFRIWNFWCSHGTYDDATVEIYQQICKQLKEQKFVRQKFYQQQQKKFRILWCSIAHCMRSQSEMISFV